MPCGHKVNPNGYFLAGEALAGQAMPLQAKALINGKRHLVYEHCLDADEVQASDPKEVCELHFHAHGFDPIPPWEASSSPWNVMQAHSACVAEGKELIHSGEPMRIWRGPPQRLR